MDGCSRAGEMENRGAARPVKMAKVVVTRGNMWYNIRKANIIPFYAPPCGDGRLYHFLRIWYNTLKAFCPAYGPLARRAARRPPKTANRPCPRGGYGIKPASRYHTKDFYVPPAAMEMMHFSCPACGGGRFCVRRPFGPLCFGRRGNGRLIDSHRNQSNRPRKAGPGHGEKGSANLPPAGFWRLS
jgi:hypothetical protein